MSAQCSICGGPLRFTQAKRLDHRGHYRLEDSFFFCKHCRSEQVPPEQREAMMEGLCAMMGGQWEVEAVLEEAARFKGRPVQFAARDEIAYAGNLSD